jgi:hypothetical protein
MSTNLKKPETLIKSKERVSKHGEVFTPKWVVKEMCNMLNGDKFWDNPFTTVLEPAVGEGAFLLEILSRKFKIINKQYVGSQNEYNLCCVRIISTLYGVELLNDNTLICREKLFQLFQKTYKRICRKHDWSEAVQVYKIVKYLLNKNIIEGNFLTKLQTDGAQIVFSEWKFDKEMVIRTDETLEHMNQKPNGLGLDMYDKPIGFSPVKWNELPKTDN